MKRLLLALALLWCAHAGAQTVCNGAAWCSGAPTLSVTSVVIGNSIVVTAPFTSSAAYAAATLDITIYDSSGKIVSQVWQTGVPFTAGQTITAQQLVYTPATGALTGIYSVSLGVFDANSTQLYWTNMAAAFNVTAPVAPTAPPSCYASSGVNLTVTLQPPAFTDWIVAANPYFIITWFCPSSTDPSGYVGEAIWGYRSELLPNWASLVSGSKASLNSLWTSAVGSSSDAELAPLATAQQTATWPQPLKTTGTTVYYVIQQPDSYVSVPVGTAPVGTACNASQSVDGMYGVPASAVTWYGSVKPLAVVAPCM